MKKTEDRELHAIRLFLKILNTLSNEEIWRVLNYLRLRYMDSAKDEEQTDNRLRTGWRLEDGVWRFNPASALQPTPSSLQPVQGGNAL